ncbi:MAG: hypothetical protein RR598_06535 [Anaerorhabdus sp.]|uniref:hypothetical protein n=1 Tax=Anaerorhabdus sp. TaxID=1872524 RepID=UPI002FCC8123
MKYVNITKDEFNKIVDYQIDQLKKDLKSYIKNIQIISVYKKMIDGSDIPAPKSPMSEGGGGGIMGDSITEDHAIHIVDLIDEVHMMQCSVERVEHGLERLNYHDKELIQKKFFERRSYEKLISDYDISLTGLKYRINKVLRKMIDA